MANQYTPQANTKTARILDYVRAHPECTTKDIAASFGLGLDQIGNVLNKMKVAGLLDSTKIPNTRCLRWAAVEVDQPDEELAPRRIVLTTWPPCTVRDPLTSICLWPQVAA